MERPAAEIEPVSPIASSNCTLPGPRRPPGVKSSRKLKRVAGKGRSAFDKGSPPRPRSAQ